MDHTIRTIYILHKITIPGKSCLSDFITVSIIHQRYHGFEIRLRMGNFQIYIYIYITMYKLKHSFLHS